MSDHVLASIDHPAGVPSALLSSGFHAGAEETDDNVVIRLHGELDRATAPRLARALSIALDARPADIVLELSQLAFVDSSGVRVLIDACQRARDEGCSLVLRSPRRCVLKVLRLTGLDKLMVIEPGTSLRLVTAD